MKRVSGIGIFGHCGIGFLVNGAESPAPKHLV